ncbi:MAG: carboxypeptidase regulatory-like domain-containing protein [Bacteroidota bacterium]|nr:carboxypeptidase regulatory-like domain-containing protein [Bacteroidota bacterium]
MTLKRFTPLLFALLLSPFLMKAQVTTSSITGFVKAADGEPLAGATVTAIHEPTGTAYTVITRKSGQYSINNMNPGGPYNIQVSYVGYNKETKEDIFLSLGEKAQYDFVASTTVSKLTEVVIATTSRIAGQSKGGIETNIGKDKIQNMPTVNRSMSDYLRVTPQASVTGDGGVSFAGQNNRYNAFYIDGAINNDVFGLAASGTNGGQAGINPISIDAIDQFQVVLNPFDASLGGFTGGGINATTRSGTNKVNGSVWYYYRDQNLAGKTPGDVPKDQRTKLDNLSNKIYGARIGGPIIKNKLFFFILAEGEKNLRPQPFTGKYNGDATSDSISKLVTFLKTKFNYDPGSYLDNPEKLNVDRITAKIDWNISNTNKFSLSYRYNKGVLYNTSASSSSRINFYNNGYLFPSTTHSATGELRSTFKGNNTNRLLLTYTNVLDNRNPLGSPFPRVTISDGSGSIVFGTENFSTANLLRQKNWTLNDIFKFAVGKNSFSVGTDNLYSSAYNVFIRDLFGTYSYSSLSDFINDAKPSRYDHSFSLLESKTDENNTPSAASFRFLNLAFFANDEIKINDRFTLNLGVRVEKTEYLDQPREDKFFNDTAISILSQYYDLRGARSGQIAKVPFSFSPRIGFTYKIPDENVTIRGGLGLFSGRIPLVWPGGVYNQNGVSLGGVSVNNPNITFRPDAFNQYSSQDLGISLANAKGEVDLISKNFKSPKIFRTSLAIDKKLGNGWTGTVELLYTKNIEEIYYQQLNILPPTLESVGPGARTVYSFSGSPTKPALRPGNINPYTDILLLYNNPGKTGFAYNFTASVEKSFRKGFLFNASYTYGNSQVTNEGTSSQNSSQWRFMETVNGRNFLPLSPSDFDLQHRIFAYASKRFSYAKDKLATTISLVYNGQSGSPFSYVYNRSLVGDRSRFESNDLIYIPTTGDLQSQIFLPNTVGGTTYTPQQQKDFLDQYIQSDKYLSKHRGQFAERNGARLPFTNILNLKLTQDFNLKLSNRTYQLQLSYDVYNFTNMIDRNWGKTYFISNDNYSLIQFAGFVSATDLTPQYKFTPQTSTPYGLSTSTAPGLSARWISQIGLRLNF